MDEQPKPEAPPPYQLAMMMQAQYQRALADQLIQAQGAPVKSFTPADIWMTQKVLILEVTALRELVLDIASTGPEGMDQNLRMQHVVAYCHKLAAIYQAQIKAMHEAPKLLVPN
jgi:hypothetical protein